MSSNKYDFTGKVVLITGSASGIGAACAVQFAQCHAKVVITGNVESEVNEMVDQIENITGERPFHLWGDLTENGFAQKLVQATIDRHGRLDVLVNNAGMCVPSDSFLESDIMKKYDKVMNLNVRTPFLMIHLCWPYLEKTKGNIINTSSCGAMRPSRWASYSTSKGAIHNLTKSAALDLGEKRIRVNSVNPGPIKTNFTRSLGIDLKDSECPFAQETILKRNGEPDEVANVYLFLASEDASYITGAYYLVDGGFTCI